MLTQLMNYLSRHSILLASINKPCSQVTDLGASQEDPLRNPHGKHRNLNWSYWKSSSVQVTFSTRVQSEMASPSGHMEVEGGRSPAAESPSSANF